MLPMLNDETDCTTACDEVGLLNTRADPAFDRLAELTAKLLGVPFVLISLIDDKRQWFKARIGVDFIHIPREHSICAHVIATGDMLVIGDAIQDLRSRDSLLVVHPPHARFYAGVPLRTADGLAVGTLCVLDAQPHSGLSPEQADILRDLGALAMVLIETHPGTGDPVSSTYLPNRFHFFQDIDDSIADLRRTDRQIAILVIDAATPNQYSELARTLGQAATDLFEDASAKSIGECLPTKTKLFGLSAARFGCILQVDALNHMEDILDRLAYGIRHPEAAWRSIPVATSVGIGVAYYPRHGTNAVELFQAAISGTHESLDSGTPWCPYNPELDRASRRAAHLLRDVGPALASTDQLRLVYQPKVDLSTGYCVGAEALLRWTHPTLGVIPPDEFVPLVEHTTFVNAMTDWALGAALPQIALWRTAGLDPQISINISMQDLWDEHFAVRLADLLERHAVRPDWVNIEVTESALMQDPVRVGRQLDEIRRMGIAIEIDDYGTGQSGLSYLKYIPASYVKIAQIFVSQLASDKTDQVIVRSTINLAHDLGLRVVAEGIRDEAALDWLRKHGCDIGQGNVLSPPLEAPRFEQMLQTSLQPSPLR